MPGLPREGEVLIRQFTGVNITIDPGFLPVDTLQQADNWIPDRTFLLTKRRGSTRVVESMTHPPQRVDALFRAYDLLGNRYFYFVGVYPTGGDILYVVKNSGVIELVDMFVHTNSRYGIAQLGNRVYVGNGLDPIKVVDLTAYATAFDLVPLAALATTGSSASPVVDPDSKLENGSYSYAWAVYSTATRRYVSRSVALTTVLDGDRARISFVAPNLALAGGTAYQLFVAPRNLPIEFAFRQFDTVAALGTVTLSEVKADGPQVPSQAETLRTGRFLTPHRGRLYISGDQANPSRVYATGTIVPGLEQDLFDIGDFFPANANLPISLNDGDEVTGMAVGSQRETNTDPRAPLVIFKNAASFVLYGDIFDDDAEFATLSQSIGCLSARTAVSTPVGVIFCGLDSVYLFAPGASAPLDIGKPISAYIRTLDPSMRPHNHAIYHDGFYKLFTVPPGGGQPTRQWWLDLRQGLQNGVAWWGMHTGGPIQSATVARRDEDNASRAYAGFLFADGTAMWDISEWDVAEWGVAGFAIDELNIETYTQECGQSIQRSRLRTTVIDNQTPFARKIFTRFRALGRADLDTTAQLQVFQDGDTAPSFVGSLDFTGTTGALWDVGLWDEAEWAAPARFTEGDLVLGGDQPRPHTLYTEFVLTHDAPVRLDLRDFAARLLPVERPVK